MNDHETPPVADPVTEPAAREATPHRYRLKLFGVGGAGGNTVAHIAAAREANPGLLAGVQLVAINTDLQALNTVAGAEQLQLGASLTHGLGAGGDPELGARCAQQELARLQAAARGADILFITAGLGGGTGTGAAPALAKCAREEGALVLAFVALPFTFEGDRRRQQALVGLEQLKQQADAVICIPNDKLFKLVGDNATAIEAFKKCDEIIASGAQAIWQLLSRKGLINLDFATLRATLGAKHGDGFFSHGEASGDNRAREAVKSLLENPLFDGGQSLGRAEGVLVSILGGPDLSIADVQKTMEPITRLAHRAHVIMGAATDDAYAGRLAVTVIAATNLLPRRVPAADKPAPAPTVRSPAARSEKAAAAAATAAAASAEPETVPAAAAPAAGTEATARQKAAAKPRQENLPLENVTRGRFDKSEPTLVDGEDLDVPTFIRRGISLTA